MEDVNKVCCLLTFSILVTLRSLVEAYPFPESARFALHRPKAVQENYLYGGSPRESGWAANQYYPPALWAEALLQLSETPRDETADYADEYAYDVGEPDDGYLSEPSDSAMSEESFKDLLLTYLLRQQELAPHVQRRNEKTTNEAASSTETPTSASTSSAPTSTIATVKFEQGQKEVPILRPPTDTHRQPFSWPKELEESNQTKLFSEKQHLHSQKTDEHKGGSSHSSKISNDLLALQLDDLKPQDH